MSTIEKRFTSRDLANMDNSYRTVKVHFERFLAAKQAFDLSTVNYDFNSYLAGYLTALSSSGYLTALSSRQYRIYKNTSKPECISIAFEICNCKDVLQSFVLNCAYDRETISWSTNAVTHLTNDLIMKVALAEDKDIVTLFDDSKPVKDIQQFIADNFKEEE